MDIIFRKKIILHFLIFCTILLFTCTDNSSSNNSKKRNEFLSGTFGYDLEFIKKYDKPIVLKNRNGLAQIIVSPKYQGKVFTSTVSGNEGKSFGWINYKLLASGETQKHINAYGGEDRLWLAPEGGQFSIFFKPGSEMVFKNWQTPSPLDTEEWLLISRSASAVSLEKRLELVNYSGTHFLLKINRKIKLLNKNEIESNLNININRNIKTIGFETENVMTNLGDKIWGKQTGTLALWNLNMLNPSPNTTVVIPYKKGTFEELGKVATTDYFGEISKDRIFYTDGVLYFKADGMQRGKLGIAKNRVKPVAGSYDENNKVLTIIKFTVPSDECEYINQLWEHQEEPFNGDVMNSYNDGPLETGDAIGPFYELESSSPAAFLKPGEKIMHMHSVFHFVGDEELLSKISINILGVNISKIKSVF